MTIGREGTEWTYPEAMDIEAAIHCIDRLIEQLKLPWEAVAIPFAALAEQADKSLTCRRAIKMARAEGIPV